MENMGIKDINYYNKARTRHTRGKMLVSDVEIVSAQEQEIEHYRKEIASYEAAIANNKIEILAIKDELAKENIKLKEENKKLKEENAKLSEEKTFKVGDAIRFGDRKYKIRKVIVNLNADEATFIGDEVALYF